MRTFLILLVCLCAPRAWADTTYVNNGSALVLSGAGAGVWLDTIAPNGGPQSATVYSAAISGGQTVSGLASIGIDMVAAGTTDTLSGKTITLTIGYRRSGVDNTLCSNTVVSTGIGNQYGATCTIPSTALVSTDLLFYKITLPQLVSTTLPDRLTASGGQYSYVTWPQTMFFCPTVGSTCTCDGICNGNACGSQFTTSSQSTACSCDCTVSGCTSLVIAAPATLTCTDSLDARNEALTWASVTNASTYTIQRGVTGVCGSPIAGTSCTDSPGVGNYTYNVFATGTCPPTIGGTTLSSKVTQVRSNSTCSVTSRGSVVIAQ